MYMFNTLKEYKKDLKCCLKFKLDLYSMDFRELYEFTPSYSPEGFIFHNEAVLVHSGRDFHFMAKDCFLRRTTEASPFTLSEPLIFTDHAEAITYMTTNKKDITVMFISANSDYSILTYSICKLQE